MQDTITIMNTMKGHLVARGASVYVYHPNTFQFKTERELTAGMLHALAFVRSRATVKAVAQPATEQSKALYILSIEFI